MYNIVKNVIQNQRYELTDILKKIDTLWIKGDLTDNQRYELYVMAREGAKIENSVDLLKKIEELDRRLTALEDALKDTPPETEDGSEESYPPFEPGKWYYAGDMVSFDEAIYKCIAPEGVVCVWSPTDYPAYWELV